MAGTLNRDDLPGWAAAILDQYAWPDSPLPDVLKAFRRAILTCVWHDRRFNSAVCQEAIEESGWASHEASLDAMYVIRSLGPVVAREMERQGLDSSAVCEMVVAVDAQGGGPPAVSERRADCLAAIKRLQAVTGGGSVDDDWDAYVKAIVKWGPKFGSYRKFKTWFDKLSEGTIRYRHKGQHLFLHAADWDRLWGWSAISNAMSWRGFVEENLVGGSEAEAGAGAVV